MAALREDLPCCWIDGLFKDPTSGGTGYLIQQAGMMVQYGGEGRPCAFSTFHMECLSLLRAMQAVTARGITQSIFLSDSQLLVSSIASCEMRRNWKGHHPDKWKEGHHGFGHPKLCRVAKYFYQHQSTLRRNLLWTPGWSLV